MSGDDSQDVQLRPMPAPADGPRGMQFSLAGLFMAVTTVAVIFSAYFGVGRWLGMTTGDLLTHGMARLVYTLPVMLVWIVGLSMAIRRLRRNRLAATLTIIALGVLVLFAFATNLLQMALIYSISSNRITSSTLSWSFSVMSIVYSVVHAGCWILILVAIFARRPPDVLATDESGSDPFLRTET